MHYAELRRAREELTGPGGQFEVVEEEILGQRMLTYKNAPPSVREFWLSTAIYGERTYFVYQDERMSYAAAHAQVTAIAAWLTDQGLVPGDRIAIAMRNYPEWMLIYWAAACVGVSSVGMNAWWTPEEMAFALTDSAPKVLFVDAERLDRLRQIANFPPPHGGGAGGGGTTPLSNPHPRSESRASERPSPTGRGFEPSKMTVVGLRLAECPAGVTPWAKVIAHPGTMPAVTVDPDSDASIFYTSGTTGFPKGAQLTHRGCIANLMNLLYAGASAALATERATGVAPPADPPIPVGLITTPLFHVTANNCGAYATTAMGGTMVLMYRWDAGEALRLIAAERCNGVGGVPVMAREIINHPDFDKYDTSSLLNMSGGGAQVPASQVLEIEAKIATARPSTGYGMTETCGVITSCGGDFFVDRPTSAGPYLPNFEAKCVDDGGNEVPLGEVGELWVKGSSVIKGYINRPDATAEAITQGWLRTGDMARIDDDRFVYIVDRKKDLVIRGGENIACSEVEAAIYRHPAVAECCVFSVPDERMGEEVGVAVVAKPGETLEPEAIRELCAAHLARHKVPRWVWVLDEPLPRNASGKFLKRELREKLAVGAET